MYVILAWITMIPVIALGVFSLAASVYLIFFAEVE